MVHYEEGLARKKSASDDYLWKNDLFYSDIRQHQQAASHHHGHHHTNAAYTDTSDCEVGLTSLPDGGVTSGHCDDDDDDDNDRYVVVVENGRRNSKLGSQRTSPRWSPFAFTWQGTLMSSTALVVLICAGLMLGRRYVLAALAWTEHQNAWLVFGLFMLLFTVVSFPLMWGYILINVACGYLYGLTAGLAVVLVTVLVGIAVSHFVMKRCFAGCLADRLAVNQTVAATLLVIGGPHTFCVVAVTRLTPIPFGFQNAIFAISPIGTTKYMVASTVGLLPTQAINTYLGSTLRSMEDVLSDSNTASTGYVIFAVQVVISIGLMAFVVHKARQVLNRVMSESEVVLDDNSCDEGLGGAAGGGLSSRSSEETLSSSCSSSGGERHSGVTELHQMM